MQIIISDDVKSTIFKVHEKELFNFLNHLFS